VWPIQQIIRTLGAYFVRRSSGDVLYRRVLERYVQMAVEGGAIQAVFPEGGLSRDGLLRKPKVGLFDYMLRSFDPDAVARGKPDIVFVPVAINYDRVLEDRTLLRSADAATERGLGFTAVKQSLLFMFAQFGLMIRRKWYRFGYACANFGTPISLRDYLNERGWNPAKLDQADRAPVVQQLAADLLMAVGRIVPVLPVSVIAKIFVDAPNQSFYRRRNQSTGAQVAAVLSSARCPRVHTARRCGVLGGSRIKDVDSAASCGGRSRKLSRRSRKRTGFALLRERHCPLN